MPLRASEILKHRPVERGSNTVAIAVVTRAELAPEEKITGVNRSRVIDSEEDFMEGIPTYSTNHECF